MLEAWLIKIRFRHELCFCACLCANQTKMHWAPHATIGVSGLRAFDYIHTRRSRLTVAVQSMTQLQQASVCDTRTVLHPARQETYKKTAAWFRRLLTNSRQAGRGISSPLQDRFHSPVNHRPLWFTRLWTIDLYGSQKQLVNPVNHMVRSAGPSTTFHRTRIRSK